MEMQNKINEEKKHLKITDGYNNNIFCFQKCSDIYKITRLKIEMYRANVYSIYF